jgi:hypothetical protein
MSLVLLTGRLKVRIIVPFANTGSLKRREGFPVAGPESLLMDLKCYEIAE